MHGLSAIVLVAVVACAIALPISQSSWEMSGKFEGDILLDPSQIGKHGMLNSSYYWTGGIMYYSIASTFTADQVISIKNAINEYNTRTCVRLVERSNQLNYVAIGGSKSGCFAQVGMSGVAQELNLARGCFSHGTIVHELLHSLGFWHQQSASDRDNFVTINWANITPGKEHNFNKYEANFVTDFGVSYDYGSIMHYGAKAFSSNNEPTIVPKDPNAVIGQRDGLSTKDIQKLHAMYKC